MDEKNLFIVTLLQEILDLPQLLVVGLFTINNFLDLVKDVRRIPDHQVFKPVIIFYFHIVLVCEGVNGK